jgi:hypothetical protein
MMEQKQPNSDEATKERWAFIEEAAREVKSWSTWKRAEVSPNEFSDEQEDIKASADIQSQVRFD